MDLKEQIQSQRDIYTTYGKQSIEVAYKKYAMSPFGSVNHLTEQQLEQKVKAVFQWAKRKGAEYYTLINYPKTERVSEKQQNFLEIQYKLENSSMNGTVKQKLSPEFFKSQVDGSSLPTGGLRKTQQARSYALWDNKSELYVRQKNKILYIPSLLVTHDGLALDDKTLFRSTQKILNEKATKLLNLMGVKAQQVIMALGLEQQFFVIPKTAYDSRLDIKTTGRALYGHTPVKNQQFCDHYYGKISPKFQQIFRQLEDELVEIGVPVKTRHKEVAINQYQFCPIYQQAGKCIDHNMIMMQILRETFQKHGYSVLLHEKPFNCLNGSGKHCNWSLNYTCEGKLKNLFQLPKDDNQKKIFTMFILLNLMAILNNAPLYMTSIATPGNQLRLGGHQAPPRVISVFLGSTISGILDNKQTTTPKNLKDEIPSINYNVYQQDTDRNRTSPYAYTGNKFEFRAVGSSQNVCFPMAVIAGTMADEVGKVITRIEKGQTIDAIIDDLIVKTAPIRFSGDGYSPEWRAQAHKRGLIANDYFEDNYNNFKTKGEVFVRIGACKEEQNQSKQETMKQKYTKIVDCQAQVLLRILDKDILNRCYDQLNKTSTLHIDKIQDHSKKLSSAVVQMIDSRDTLENCLKNAKNLEDSAKLRQMVFKTAEKIESVMKYLPRDPKCPELDEFLGFIDQ